MTQQQRQQQLVVLAQQLLGLPQEELEIQLLVLCKTDPARWRQVVYTGLRLLRIVLGTESA